MTEQEPQVPSANDLSLMVFGSDMSEHINIFEMFEYAKERLEQANERGDLEEISVWETNLGLITEASPDLRTKDN